MPGFAERAGAVAADCVRPAGILGLLPGFAALVGSVTAGLWLASAAHVPGALQLVLGAAAAGPVLAFVALRRG
jgi:hypothetical protein